MLWQALCTPLCLALGTVTTGASNTPAGNSRHIRPDRVAIYIRWSTDDQSTGTSLETQREACEHYVRSQGWQVREDLIFIDDGYSGGTLDRPAMRRLRQMVKRGEIDCIVVLKIDRLTRNIVDAVDLVLREWADRCHLKAAQQPIDTTNDLGRMIFGILAMFADFERSQIRDRTQSGKTRRIENGEQMHGEPALGYMRDPERLGVWIENPQEAPLVRRMFRLAAEGMSANAICRLLNREGTRTRSGAQFSVRTVLHILHNQTYIGRIRYGATSLIPVENANDGAAVTMVDGTLATRRPLKPRKRRVIHDAPRVERETRAVQALIDEETFRRVQDQLTANRAQRRNSGARSMQSPNLLVGIAKCTCGAAIVHKPQTGTRNRQRGVQYRHYICSHSRIGRCTTNAGYIPQDVADKYVEQYFLSLYGLRETRMERLRPHVEAVNEDQRAVAAALKSAQERRRQLDHEELQLQRDARAGKVALADVKWLREGIERDRQQVDERIQQLRNRQSELEIRMRSLEATLEALEAVEQWELLETWRKRQLLQLVLTDRITIWKRKKTEEIVIEPPWAY